MELDSLQKHLKLIEILTDNDVFTRDEICRKIGLAQRSYYHYIEDLKNAGFIVTRRNGLPCILPSSPFVQRMGEHLRLSSYELSTLRSVLEAADNNNRDVCRLKARLQNTYGLEFRSDGKMSHEIASNLDTLHLAVEQHRMVILHDYASNNSSTKRDRLVEPFDFLLGGLEVRCYEIESQMCKNYKVSRIKGKVEILDREWENIRQHTIQNTDIFGFSSDRQMRVRLRLGIKSHALMMEEYGVPPYKFIMEDDTHWIIGMQVCSYQGIGRFVMGMLSDIEIIDSPDFEKYICKNLQLLTKKMKISSI